MNWLFLILLSVVLVELLVRLPLLSPLTDISRTSRQAMHVAVTRSISDHWKERAMGAYARRTMLATCRLAALLSLVGLAATVIVLAFGLMSAGFEHFVLGWQGIAGSLVFACLYAVFRSFLFRA